MTWFLREVSSILTLCFALACLQIQLLNNQTFEVSMVIWMLTMVCSKNMLNSTPTQDSKHSSPFHIPSLPKVKGLYLDLSSFRECLQKVWNVQFRWHIQSLWRETSQLIHWQNCKWNACVAKQHIPGVGALRSACILDIPLPALFQLRWKKHDKELPPTKSVDEVSSIPAPKRTQQSGSGS